MELADAPDRFDPRPDRRPPIPEPPPVRLVAVADVVILAGAGVERELDALYVGVLRFERADVTPDHRPAVQPILGADVPQVPPPRADRPLPGLPPGAIRGPVYRAENHRLCVEVHEPPVRRDDLRPVGVEVPSLAAVEAELLAREVEHERRKGLLPGHEGIWLQDAGGNWVEVVEMRPV